MLSRLFDKYFYLTIIIIAHNNITRQYRDSFLGIVWTLLQPACEILIYAFVFPKIMRFPEQNYVSYLVASHLTWSFLNLAMLSATNSLVYQGEAIKRITIPTLVFPVAEVCRCFYTYMIALGLALVCVITPQMGLSASWIVLPLYLGMIMVTMAALGIALAFITPYVRDLPDIVAVGMKISFWLTPVVYPISLFTPERQTWFEFNPFYILIRPVQTIIFKQQIPSFHETVTVVGLMLLTVAVSRLIHVKLRKGFVFYL